MKPLSDATKKLFEPLRNLYEDDWLEIRLNDESDKFILRTFQLYETSDGEIRESYPSYTARKHFFYRFPERLQLHGCSSWQVPATDISVALIDALWPKDRMKFEGQETEILFEYLKLLGEQKDKFAETTARYKEEKVVPEKEGVEGHPFLPLADYQRTALVNSVNAEGYSLFMEQGTGKTPVVIARVCCESVNVEHQYRCLVLCPKNVRMNWEREFEKFATVDGKVTVIRGNELDRAKQLVEAMRKEQDCEYSVVVMSYDNLARTWPMVHMIEWDLAVLDESHYIKSPRTKRWKFAQKLRDTSKARMCLTGTPITNTPLDLYTQFEFLGKGWSGFSNWKSFRNFYGVFEQGYNGFEKLVGLQNLPWMQERLARQSFIVRKSEALPDLPDKVYDVFEVEMTPIQKEVYNKVATELALEIENELDSGKPKQLLINNILTQLLRLAQITSGFIVWDSPLDSEGVPIGDKEIESLTPNPKLDGLVELLKNKSPNDKTLVWACWVHDIERIKERLDYEGIGCVTYYGSSSDADR